MGRNKPKTKRIIPPIKKVKSVDKRRKSKLADKFISLYHRLLNFFNPRKRKKASMNNKLDTNQHYITESFVKKRFGVNGFIQRYDVKHNSWKNNASPQFTFSGKGYTQFLEKGQDVDNSLEQSFSSLESKLIELLPALDDAAERNSISFPEDQYNTLCFYCAYLWYLSPFLKAAAPVNFVNELDVNLKNNNWDYLRKRGMPEDVIARMKAQYEQGYKFILAGENYLQFVFRDQFIRNCREKATHFRYRTKWTVYNSPIELPISDIALIDMPEPNVAVLYILPIAPNRVLIGRSPLGSPPPYYSTETIVYGDTLSKEAAEEVLEVICYSAVKAIACKNKMDIKAIRERAKNKKVSFHKIANLDEVLTAGLKVFDREKDLSLIPVTPEKFIKYVHSYVLPAQ